MKKKRSIFIGLVFIFIFVLLLFYFYISPSPFTSPQVYQRRRFLMGTLATISVVSGHEKEAVAAIERAFQILQEIEKQAGRTIPGSFTSQINKMAGEGNIFVPSPFLELIRASIDYSGLSEGAFDITIGSIMDLWHFEDGKGDLPEPEAIRQHLPLVGREHLYVDKAHSLVGLKKAGAMIDLGGVAKGFAVDRAIGVLKEAGITGGIVNAGGGIRVFGSKPGLDKYWHIGIQHPRKPNEIMASIKLTDKSISTSGDYERFFFKNNIRYHHILDPKTGQPAGGCQSVTIVSETSMQGDALSTAVFVLGPQKGMALIEKLPQVEGIIIDSQGKAIVSSGLQSGLIWGENSN